MTEVRWNLPQVLVGRRLPEMLETVTRLLRDDFEIVGDAQDGEDAIQAATTRPPPCVPGANPPCHFLLEARLKVNSS